MLSSISASTSQHVQYELPAPRTTSEWFHIPFLKTMTSTSSSSSADAGVVHLGYEAFLQRAETAVREEMRKQFALTAETLPGPAFTVTNIETVIDERRFQALCAQRREVMLASKLKHVPIALTFHGTWNLAALDSIVEVGYVLPGDIHPQTKKVHSMRHGAFHGDGIYSSTFTDLSLMYSLLDDHGNGVFLVNFLVPGRVSPIGVTRKNKRSRVHYIPSGGTFSGVLSKSASGNKTKLPRGPDGRRALPRRSYGTPDDGTPDDEEEFEKGDFETIASPDGRVVVSAWAQNIVPAFRVTVSFSNTADSFFLLGLKKSSQKIWHYWDLSPRNYSLPDLSHVEPVEFCRIARDVYSIRLPLALSARGQDARALSTPLERTSAGRIVDAAIRSEVLPSLSPQHVVLVPKYVMAHKERTRQVASFVDQLLATLPRVQDSHEEKTRVDGCVKSVFWGRSRSYSSEITSSEMFTSLCDRLGRSKGLRTNAAKGKGGVIGALDDALDRITDESDNEKYFSVVYVLLPPGLDVDDDAVEQLVNKYTLVVQAKTVAIKLLVWTDEAAPPASDENSLQEQFVAARRSKRALKQAEGQARETIRQTAPAPDYRPSILARVAPLSFVKSNLQSLWCPEEPFRVIGDAKLSAFVSPTPPLPLGEVLSSVAKEFDLLAEEVLGPYFYESRGMHDFSMPSGFRVLGQGFLNGLHTLPAWDVKSMSTVLYKGPQIPAIMVDGSYHPAHFSDKFDIDRSRFVLLQQLGSFRNLAVGAARAPLLRHMPLVAALCNDVMGQLDILMNRVTAAVPSLPAPPLPAPDWSPDDAEQEHTIDGVICELERDKPSQVVEGKLRDGWETSSFYGIPYFFHRTLQPEGIVAWNMPISWTERQADLTKRKKLAAKEAGDSDGGELRRMRRKYFEARRLAKAKTRVDASSRYVRVPPPPLRISADWKPSDRGIALRFVKAARGLYHRLSGIASDLTAFGDIKLTGVWFSRLTNMAFGRRIAKRVTEIDSDAIEAELGLEKGSLPNPEDALAITPALGLPVTIQRSAASEVEPWMAIVLYAGRELTAPFARAYFAASSNDPPAVVGDSRAEDVLPLSHISHTIGRMAHAWVLTRNPFLPVPGQRTALFVVSWVLSIEQLFREFNPPSKLDDEQRHALNARVLARCETILELTKQVRFLVTEYVEPFVQLVPKLLDPKLSAQGVASALTTVHGILSVCLALGCLTLASAGPIFQRATSTDNNNEPLRVLPFALLEESVARSCRAYLTATGADNSNLIRATLGITTKSDPEHYKFSDFLMSAVKLTGRFYNRRLTNCTPFALVATFGFLEHFHRFEGNPTAEQIAKPFQDRDICMKNFLFRFMGPTAVGAHAQIALFLNGVKFFKGSQRDSGQGSIDLNRPMATIEGHIEEQLGFVRWQREAREQASSRLGHRRNKRLVLFSKFRPYHTTPRLFTEGEVAELNARRSPDDQLVLLPGTGLLRDHCCYPNCPKFLVDLSSTTDKQERAARAGPRKNDKRVHGRAQAATQHGRLGLRRHLGLDQEFGNYARSFHLVAVAGAKICKTFEEFETYVGRNLPKAAAAYWANSESKSRQNLESVWKQVHLKERNPLSFSRNDLRNPAADGGSDDDAN